MEKRVTNPWAWQDQFGFVQANEISGVERTLICSGQISLDADGGVLHEGDMRAQVGTSMDNLETVLTSAGFELADVVKLVIYSTDVDAYLQSADVVASRTGEAGCTPAMTLLGVSRLAFPQLLVEIEATAFR